MTKREWGFAISLFTVSILLFSNTTSANTANIDYSSFGVTEGDTFVYELSRFDITDDVEDTTPIDFDNDGFDDMYLKEGDQFVMTIVDTTIVKRDYADEFQELFDQNSIEVSFSRNGNSITAYSVVDAGHWVTLTDWDNLIPHFEELLLDAEIEGNKLGGVSSFSITETEDLVEIDSSATATESGVTVKVVNDVILNKTTGVKVYTRAVIEISVGGDSARVDLIFKLVDFSKSEGSGDGFLPAFEATFVIVALSSVITIVYKKRKNSY